MLRLFFKSFFRNLKKNKLFSIINALGLVSGITAFLIIFSYTQDQRSYDSFHPKVDRLYKLNSEFDFTGELEYSAYSFAEEGEALKDNLPEVNNYARVIKPFDRSLAVKGNERQYEKGILYADSTFFDLFGFDLEYGNPKKALSQPWQVVITAEIAKKYFKTSDAIGKTLVINDELHTNRLVEVSGVIDLSDKKTHLDFEMLFPIETIEAVHERIPYLVYTYLVLSENSEPAELQSKLPGFLEDHHPRPSYLQRGITLNHQIEKVSEIYHSSTADEELSYGIGYRNLNILLGIGIIVLLIAAINYVNLTTAQYIRRGLEIGLKKVVGSSKKSLMMQFIIETLFFTSICSIASLFFFLMLAEPVGDQINIDIPFRASIVFIALISGIILGLIAGIYPAFYLSSIKVTTALKQKNASGKDTALLRKSLVVIQFGITIFLLVATFIIREQFIFLTNYDGGISDEGLISISLPDSIAIGNADLLKKNVLQESNIIAASITSFIPHTEKEEDFYVPEGKQTNENILFPVINVDADYLKTFDVQLISGRNFEANAESDRSYVLINREMAEYLDWEEALGRTMTRAYDTVRREIIGIVEDFNISSLHEPMEPFIVSYRDEIYPFRYMVVKVSGEKLSASLKDLDAIWGRINPHLPFDYSFLSDDLKMSYTREATAYNLFLLFAGLSILLGCLGLFGLSTFIVQQRLKEIGVRKVLGASIWEVLLVLLKEYMLLVLISCALVLPFAIYFMNDWLQSFSYKVGISVLMIVVPVAIALIIAFISVSYNCLKAALTNPVNVIRRD